MIEIEAESPITHGFYGCEWKAHSFKTRPPLGGQLNLNILNCPIEKKYRSEYGYKDQYFLNDENQLCLKRTPADPKFPDTKQTSCSFLYLHSIGKQDLQSYMQNFVKTDVDPNCKIRQNSDGLWRIGYEKDYLENQGWSFIGEKDDCQKASPQYEPKTLYCMTEDDFPTSFVGASKCSFKDEFSSISSYRASGPILFEFVEDLMEPHPDDQAIIDKYSVEYVE